MRVFLFADSEQKSAAAATAQEIADWLAKEANVIASVLMLDAQIVTAAPKGQEKFVDATVLHGILQHGGKELSSEKVDQFVKWAASKAHALITAETTQPWALTDIGKV